MISPAVLLLLRIVFAILGLLPFQMNLRIALFMSLKNCVEILMGIGLKLWIPFWYNDHFYYVNSVNT